jgi:hypothetical protein
MDDILSLYKKYNRPGAQKLFLLAKSEGIQTTLKDVWLMVYKLCRWGNAIVLDAIENISIISYVFVWK